MLKIEDIPPHLQALFRELLKQAKDFQAACSHDWQKITWRDLNYSPRVDGQGIGHYTVIKGFRCSKCNLSKSIEGTPSQICRICGGEMKHDREERYQQTRVFVAKCTNCGHEYDTT